MRSRDAVHIDVHISTVPGYYGVVCKCLLCCQPLYKTTRYVHFIHCAKLACAQCYLKAWQLVIKPRPNLHTCWRPRKFTRLCNYIHLLSWKRRRQYKKQGLVSEHLAYTVENWQQFRQPIIQIDIEWLVFIGNVGG